MRVLKCCVAILLLVIGLARAANYTNPLKQNGPDPFLVWHNGFWYLLTTSTPIVMTRARTIEGLKTGERKTVWSDSTAGRNRDFWAPEVHNFGGTWHLYYTASGGDQVDLNRRVHVLRGGASPWDTYTYAGVTGDTWGIDGSVLDVRGTKYLIWSCRTNGLSGTQSLCIGTLPNPVNMQRRSILAVPTQSWETNGFPVNEGPTAVYRNGRIYIAFSASFCGTAQYALGLLTFNGGDPLDRNSWTKTGPHFTSANGNYGTGHNCFVLNPGTRQDWWNVYHATANRNGGCDSSRYTMFQKLNWNANGSPNFGTPVAQGVVLQGPSGENV